MLDNVTWDICFESGDEDKGCAARTNSFQYAIRQCIPNLNKVVMIRPNDLPWYNSNLHYLKRRVELFHRKAKKRKVIKRTGRTSGIAVATIMDMFKMFVISSI